MKCISTLFVGVVLLSGIPFASAQIWTQTSAPSNSWRFIASSADGSKLVALSNPYDIYVSTNSGSTWQKATNGPVLLPGTLWNSLAGSADGCIWVATAFWWTSPDNGGIYVSTNSGIGWTQTSTMSYLEGIACSADGAKMTVLDYGYGNLTSTNSGRTWTQTSTQYIAWDRIAGSADGTKLTAATFGFNTILLSTNSGVTWSQHNGPPNNAAFPMASSADGSKLAGVSIGIGIFTSTNSGAVWISNAVPSASWCGIASTADGTKLVAVATNGFIFTSTNAGAGWRSNSVPRNYWVAVASSADGNKLAAAVNGGGIYTCYIPPKPWLCFTTSNNNLGFSWTVASTNFVLQQLTNLTKTDWVELTNAVVLNCTNLQYQVTLPLTNGMGFYRLKTP